MKKSLLAKTVVLGLMTATIWSFAGVASAEVEQNLPVKGVILKYVQSHIHKNEQIDVKITTDEETGLKDPNLSHNNPDLGNNNGHTDQCGEKIDDTDLTIGDINNVVDTLVYNDNHLKEKIDAEAQAREAADTTLNNKITKETKDREANDIVSGNIDKSTGEITLTKGDKNTIRVGEICDSRLETATYNREKGELTLTVKDHYNNDQEKEIKVGDIASKEKLETETKERIAEDTRIEQKFDGEVSRLDSKIDKLDGRIEKVGAMSAAIANLHTMGYDPAAPTEIAVGVGQYRDKTGLAVGAFHYPNRDFMMSFSVSTAGDEFMAGIGATWKIGRKSPEQMLKAQQEKAARERLAEAEAMKQAAKDARVAAQQARHAKMLAERSK